MPQANSNNRSTHAGEGSEFFVIFIVNVLLTILTLGVFVFWAKARNRRYLWSHSSFDGEQFEYDGTGLEMFIGFLKALGIILAAGIGVSLIASLMMMAMPALGIAFLVLIYLGFIFLIPRMAKYGAQKYILSRTRYRSIRFGLSGSAVKYGLKGFGYSLLTMLTLGFFSPYGRMKLTSFQTNQQSYGNEPFSFTGVGGDLMKPFVISWLLTIPTLGLIWFWYLANAARYTIQQTKLGDLEFDASFTNGQYFGLIFTNLLLILFTLGLAMPWVVVRSTRFMANHLVVNGQLDYAKIEQTAEKASATGEGLAEALDVGFAV